MRVTDRLGALSGAAGIVITIVGSDVLGTPPGEQSTHPTGEQVITNLRWVADHSSAQTGVRLELLGFSLLIVFIGYLAARVRGGGWLATAALAGGVVEVGVKLGSAAPMFAAYLLRDEISPETARMLVDMNGAAFVVSWLPMGVFVACAAGAGLTSGTIGRVLGWGGVLVGSLSVVAAVAAGPNVLSAVFVPFLLCGLWILCVSIRLGLWRVKDRQSFANVAAEPVPV